MGKKTSHQVGAGSFGAVWKADCRGQEVAVKCLGERFVVYGGLQDEGASIGISRCSYFASCSERNFKFAPFV